MAGYLQRLSSLESFQTTSDNNIVLDHENVWKDTDANHSYSTYMNASFHKETFGIEAISGSSVVLEEGGEIMVMEQQQRTTEIAVGRLPDAGKKKFRGKKKILPGALFLLLITGIAMVLITLFGIQEFNNTSDNQDFQNNVNPKRTPVPILPPLICSQPNFVVQGTNIVSIDPSGEKTVLKIQGVNWGGMENTDGVPRGLAFGQANIDTIATQLIEDGFNAVRLSISAMGVVLNTPSNIRTFVDPLINPTIGGAKTYINMLQAVVQSLGKSQIGVVLDIRKLDPSFPAGGGETLWFSDEFSIADFDEALVTLAQSLCSNNYWNIIGIDLKNEPIGGCWPGATGECSGTLNWQAAASRFSSILLSECPSWLVFVQGLADRNLELIGTNSVRYFYDDWRGSSLTSAATDPVVIPDFSNKVVYSPHFYSPSVFPSTYFFVESNFSTGAFQEFTSSQNATLKSNMNLVMDRAFGDISGVAPVVIGEFGGIFGKADIGAAKTSTRALENIIEYINSNELSGGFMYSLTPDNLFSFNGVFNPTNGFQFGLYQNNFEAFNEDYVTGLRQLSGSGKMPCFDPER